MIETLGKYIIDNKSDFANSINFLEQHNIQPIPFNTDDDRKNHHNRILIDFFKIDKKNIIENLNLIFYNSKIEKNFYTTFPLSKLIEIQKNDEYDNNQTEILFPYIKITQNYNQILEPLEQVIQNKHDRYINLNKVKEKQILTIYKYVNDNNNELEIIKTHYYSKNPLYGLVHYINLNPFIFQNKYLVLQELETITIDKNEFIRIKDFFKLIKSEDYTFKLNIENNVNNLINVSFYKNVIEKNYKQILTFNNFSIEFLLNVFKDLYTFENILIYLDFHYINMEFYYEQKQIEVYINTVRFKFERDSKLISKFLNDFIRNDSKKTLKERIFLFKEPNFIDNEITVENYFNYHIGKNIIYSIKEKIK